MLGAVKVPPEVQLQSDAYPGQCFAAPSRVASGTLALMACGSADTIFAKRDGNPSTPPTGWDGFSDRVFTPLGLNKRWEELQDTPPYYGWHGENTFDGQSFVSLSIKVKPIRFKSSPVHRGHKPPDQLKSCQYHKSFDLPKPVVWSYQVRYGGRVFPDVTNRNGIRTYTTGTPGICNRTTVSDGYGTQLALNVAVAVGKYRVQAMLGNPYGNAPKYNTFKAEGVWLCNQCVMDGVVRPPRFQSSHVMLCHLRSCHVKVQRVIYSESSLANQTCRLKLLPIRLGQATHHVWNRSFIPF